MDHEDIFVDTGAWVALADEDDTHHGSAIAIYPPFDQPKGLGRGYLFPQKILLCLLNLESNALSPSWMVRINL